MCLSTRHALKVYATELADYVVELLWLLVCVFADQPRKHVLNLVGDEIFPGFAVKVTFHKTVVQLGRAWSLTTVEWMVARLLQVKFEFAFCAKDLRAVIVAALENLWWL